MMKKAFTLVEIIFVIIILGILSAGAIMSIPDNRRYSDIHFITNTIKATQMHAMRYDHYDFSNPTWRDNFYASTCIDTANIKIQEENSKSARVYQLRSTITAAKICFDSLGRPYKDNYRLNNLLKTPILLDIKYKNSVRKIKIMPFSGSIMIEK
jgi:prepilin-type N-terminal cleavage/methylation domain-containing protein